MKAAGYQKYLSQLLIFPEVATEDMSIEEFAFECDENGTDTEYQIILKYQMTDESGYENEKQRLAQLTGNDEKALLLTDVNAQSVYLTAWWNLNYYEYVLFDDDKRQFTCIYSQLLSPDKDIVGMENLLDTKMLKEEVTEQFSIYE